VKRTPLRRVGLKTRRKATERRKVVEQVHERDNHQCQAPFRVGQIYYGDDGRKWVGSGSDFFTELPGYPITCSGPLDVHEVIPRSVWPDGELVVSNCVCVCRRHHEWIDGHPAAALVVGLHGHSWERGAA
jgi:hypothetical protein